MKKIFYKIYTNLLLALKSIVIFLMFQIMTGEALAQESEDNNANKKVTEMADVYFTNDISSLGIMKLYDHFGDGVSGKVAIKIHVGDPGNKNFLAPSLVKDLTNKLKGTLVDSNVIYGGLRMKSKSHKKVAKDHGFDFATFKVLDEEGDVSIPIVGGKNLTEAWVGKDILNYDALIVLSHFKGHSMAGFGGALKNLAMGIASPKGKAIIHLTADWSLNDEERLIYLSQMADYGKGISDYFKGQIIYINALNNLALSCDCDPNAGAPSMDDIGILAASDLVALEKASLDLVKKQAVSKEHALVQQINQLQGELQIKFAEEIGLGTSSYNLINIDKVSLKEVK